MKSKLALYLTSIFLAVSALPTFGQSFLSDGLVAYYPLNGNANDDSGNNFNGIPYAVTSVTNRFGVAASACGFNGSNSVITIAPLASVSLYSMTLSAWINLAAAPNVQAFIIDKWAGYVPSQDDYGLDIRNDLQVVFSNHDHVSPSGSVIGSTNRLTLDQWYHIVAAIDTSGHATLWVNGKAAAVGNLYPPVAPSIEPVRIGQLVDGTGAVITTFNGSIDDLRIYNRVFSDSEVAQLYAYESVPQCIPHAAKAVAQVVNGFIVGATVTDPGCGYTNVPTVTITGGNGTGATATATISNGSVTDIHIVGSGSGYPTNTIIRISSPPFVPWLELGVSKVKVTLHVNIGKNYILESSHDLATWTQVGTQFTPLEEVLVQEFDVVESGRYFRVVQVQ